MKINTLSSYQSDIDALLTERDMIQAMLEDWPTENVLERYGLEARLEKVKRWISESSAEKVE